MTVTLDYAPDMEKRLRDKAAHEGRDADSFVRQIVEKTLADESDPAYLFNLPLDERRRIMQKQFEKAAPLYNPDLALPVAQRELTAFTALDGEPFLEDYTPEGCH